MESFLYVGSIGRFIRCNADNDVPMRHVETTLTEYRVTIHKAFQDVIESSPYVFHITL